MKKTDYRKELASFDKADLVDFISKYHRNLSELVDTLRFTRYERKSKWGLAQMDSAMKDIKAATSSVERLAAQERFDKANKFLDLAWKEFDKE